MENKMATLFVSCWLVAGDLTCFQQMLCLNQKQVNKNNVLELIWIIIGNIIKKFSQIKRCVLAIYQTLNNPKNYEVR